MVCSLVKRVTLELVELRGVLGPAVLLSGRGLECALYLKSGEFDGDFNLLDSVTGCISCLEGDESEALGALLAVPKLLHGNLDLDYLTKLLHDFLNIFLGNVVGERSQLDSIGIVLRDGVLDLLLLTLLVLELLKIESTLLLLRVHGCISGIKEHLLLLSFLLLKLLESALNVGNVAAHYVSVALLLSLPLQLLLEVLLFELDLVVSVPDVFPLDGGQVDVLTDVIVGVAETEGLHLSLPLEEVLGDATLDDEGAHFDLLLDLLLNLVLHLVDDLLGLLGLHGLLVKVVLPGREDLGG